MALTNYRNIKRLHRIVSVLIKYGFGWLVKDMRLFSYATAVQRLILFRKARGKEGLTTPERVRMVLEELGPSFVKLGQVVSTRADLLPPGWVEEFRKLQDMVPPITFEAAKGVVERSLKEPLANTFKTFEEEPVASASIAQVHYATLPDGTPVAVKVRRPGIGKVIESDISVMYTVARLIDRYVPNLKRYRPTEVVDEFSRIIHKEQDFTIEGANTNRFQRIFDGDPTVHIPTVYWEHTTHEVLTLERLEGIPFDEVDRIKGMGIDVEVVVGNALNAFFKQVFEHGVFHADLHPGNIFVKEDGTIIYLDFGIVGTLDKNLRRYLASMLYHLMKQDYYGAAVVHRDMGLISRRVDIHEFEDALREITDPIFGKSLESIDVPGLIMKLLQTARTFEMKLQPNLLLLQKSMVIIEGTGRQLCPNINMWDFAKPLITRWMIKEKVSPKRVYERERERVGELMDVAANAPYQVSSLLNRALDDDVKIGFVHHRLENLTDEIHTLGKRVTAGLIVAALILGSSLLLAFASDGSVLSHVVPWLGVAGFVLTIVIVVGFALSLRKSSRKRE
ncbi:MAG: 2-polyprenylphenol 6-hydroxylase [Thermodesulfobacteriota bacterium]